MPSLPRAWSALDSTMTVMISSGIDLLDARIGGLTPGRIYLVTGGAGCGKTIAALQFLHRGLRDAQRVAMLSQANPPDLIQQASHIGIDLLPTLRSGRFVLLGYQPDFARRFSRSVDLSPVFEEMERSLESGEGRRVSRFVIDSAAPFWQARDPGTVAARLAEWLEGFAATTLVTLPREMPAPLEAHLDWLTQRAFGLFQFELRPDGRRQIVVRKLLPPREVTGPISFEIRPGLGIVPLAVDVRRRAGDLPEEVKRRLLLLDLVGGCPEHLRALLAARYEVRVTSDPVEALPELLESAFGSVVIYLSRDVVPRAIHVCRQVRRVAPAPPILLLSEEPLRAGDRALGLAAGADDFLTGALNPGEVSARLGALLRRGRSLAPVSARAPQRPEQPRDGSGRPRAMSGDELTAAVDALLRANETSVFSVLRVRSSKPESRQRLTQTLLNVMRSGQGDLVGRVDGEILVVLQGASEREAERFLGRVSEALGNGGRGVQFTREILTYPAQANEIDALLKRVG